MLLKNSLSILLFQKSTQTPADRSFAFGTMAETLKACGKASAPLTEDILPVFMKGITDTDSEVRNNAVFGLGIIITNAEELLHKYPFYNTNK